MDKKIFVYLTAIFLLTCRFFCFSDEIAYRERLKISVENKDLVIIHYHDWSKDTDKKRNKMITTHQDPFLSDNDYSYLECRDKKTGHQNFKKPVPALTKIQISSDSNYIIGLSKIKVTGQAIGYKALLFK
jgi:hypothetical protein